MSAEYVKITPLEMTFGETSLLQSQLNLLTMLKQYQEYEVLRKEELFLKIELKKKLGETREFLDNLSKSLPESKFLEEQIKKEKMQKEITEKIESSITKSKKYWGKDWKEKGELERKSFIEVVEESERFEKKEGKKKEIEKNANLSPLDQELEEIRKKLERLQ